MEMLISVVCGIPVVFWIPCSSRVLVGTNGGDEEFQGEFFTAEGV